MSREAKTLPEVRDQVMFIATDSKKLASFTKKIHHWQNGLSF
jgi:hypothetical protein